MKIFNINPIYYNTGDVLNPENYNTNLATAQDTNNDVYTSRYTRWTNTYQFKNIANISAANELKQYLAKPEYFASNLNLTFATSVSVPNGPVGTITLLDVHVRDRGDEMYVLYNDSGRTPSRIIQRYKLTTLFDITTATYLSEVSLSTATYTTVNTFTIAGGAATTTGIFFGTSAGIINRYVLNTSNPVTFTIGTSATSTLNVSADYASLSFIRFLRDTSNSIPVNYIVPQLGLGNNDGTKLFYSNGSSLNYRERSLNSPFSLGVLTNVTNTVSTTIKGLSITYPYSQTEVDNYGYGGGIYLNTSNNLISSTAPEVVTATEINQKATTFYTTIQNMYVSPQGLGAYFCADNNKIGYIPFQTPHMAPPQIGIERIIVTAYFTGAFSISFNGFNKDSSLNPDTMYLTGEGNVAETNSAIKWGEFSAKKVILNNYINGVMNIPYFQIATHTAVSPSFTIVRLDVEIHYVSDRGYSPVTSYVEPDADLSSYYITEANTPDATLISASDSEFKRISNINLGLNGAVRWGVYRMRSWTSSSEAVRIFKTYPSVTYSATAIGMIVILETVSGANVPAATYTAQYGSLTLTRTIAAAANTVEFLTCANLGSTNSINVSTSSLPDESTASTRNDLQIFSTVATAMNATVYILYA